ncbi:hypothetical protein N7492_003805 [Penicillium capsulatum]|uniref:Uncharacterized protein n=1 Tax=Penicillium capsulatum TaxID=69766 RepID=A0A9W9LWX2_9EURO|nr:hypothetical protein N7492_003805 [Penicillium capsulatum]
MSSQSTRKEMLGPPAHGTFLATGDRPDDQNYPSPDPFRLAVDTFLEPPASKVSGLSGERADSSQDTEELMGAAVLGCWLAGPNGPGSHANESGEWSVID